MKTNFYSALASVAMLATLASCQKEASIPVPSTREVTVTASIPDAGITRVALTQDGSDRKLVKLSWESTDRLTINGETFTIKPETISADGHSAQFTGTEPAAVGGKYDISYSDLPGTFSEQTQSADGNTDHLGYGVALTGADSYEEPGFSAEWASAHGATLSQSSVLRLRATLPAAVAAAVKKVSFVSDADVFDGGKKLTVSLATAGTAGSDHVLDVYATLPAGDVTLSKDMDLLVRFQVSDDENDRYTAWRRFASGTAFIKSGDTQYLNMSCANIERFAGKDDDGTEAKPYLIGDRHQMDAMHQLLGDEQSKYFRMVDDVDLSGIAAWQPLTPSRDSQRNLHFDGDGHTISNLTAGSSYDYPSFAGFLWGEVHDVVFDHATIACGSGKEQSGGVVSGYIGGGSYVGNCRNVTISNSSVTTGGSNAYVGGLGGRVGNAGSFMNCHVVNTTVAATVNNATNIGGMLSYIASNSDLVIADCTAEDISVTGGGHYAAGLVSAISSPHRVIITRCHTTGEVKRSGSGRHFGGLVGSVQCPDVTISNCWSSCSVTGYQFNGGLVGSWWTSGDFTGGSGLVDHCFASGKVTDAGNSGDGGLVGSLEVPGVTISNSIAWNEEIKANKYGEGNYSTGAIVGRTHPNSILLNNYRKPGLAITAYWVPSANFDQPDSRLTGDTYFMWRIGTDLNESNGSYTTATAFVNPLGTMAYHGKHLDPGITVTADDTYGWVSSSPIPGIPDPAQDDTENPAYTGNNVWNKGTTSTLVDGVTYTNFHGTWLGKTREINIITTTLNEHNKLRIYYNYEDEGLLFLNEKCDHVNAVAATNGSMTSQYIRVNWEQKRPGKDADGVWMHNCALTIDGDDVDIVKVNNNADASTLSTGIVSCAGPLLVWKGNKLTASSEWLAADTSKWLTDGDNAGGQPRTAIGISKDGKKVIQVTVDGRWTSSNTAQQAYGMATDELAQLMLELGCYKAMNLDGGGGTQMWVYDRGDVNHMVNHPHNTWPVYGTEGGSYYWIKNNQVARRTACSAVYIYSDLKN